MQRNTGTAGVASPSNDSALRGATFAFRASPSPSDKTVSGTASSYGGAVAAATKAGSTGPPLSWKGANALKADRTGDSTLAPGQTVLQRKQSQMDGAAVASASSIYREASPSYIAATRAASRSRPPTLYNGVVNNYNQRSKTIQQSPATPNIEAGLDETPIPPTTRLVELFEAKQRREASSPIIETKELESRKQDNILSPTPIRPSLSIRIKPPIAPIEIPPEPIKSGSPPRSEPHIPNNLRQSESMSKDVDSPSQMTNTTATKESKVNSLPPKAPAPRRKTQPKIDQKLAKAETEENTPQAPVQAMPRPIQPSQEQSVRQPPRLPPPRRTRPASVAPRSEPNVPVARTSSTPPVLPRRLVQLPPGKLKAQLTADSLANAMVASSLASSRAPSPLQSQTQRPEPLFRNPNSKPHSISSFFLLHSPTHSPSPPKLIPSKAPVLRSTLRPSPSSSEGEESTKHRHRQHKHKHGFLIKKHPNKHAEGTRRHWHDSITEQERKRYEGVWAANRGLLISHELAIDPTAEQDQVHGLVVRDIFLRSGLSDRVLSEIWELVEGGGQRHRLEGMRKGRLRRHEFVVGLWLVDQCLKGRKLPVQVQESVWNSAKGLMSGLRTR